MEVQTSSKILLPLLLQIASQHHMYVISSFLGLGCQWTETHQNGLSPTELLFKAHMLSLYIF